MILKSKQLAMTLFLLIATGQSYAEFHGTNYLNAPQPDYSAVANFVPNVLEGYEMARAIDRIHQEEQIRQLQILLLQEQIRILREQTEAQ